MPRAPPNVAIQEEGSGHRNLSTQLSLIPGELGQGGLVLSPSLEVIPRKLVEKIQAGRFLEMKELLQDNISLLAQLEEVPGQASVHVAGATRPRLREVTSLASWTYCFLGYMAALTTDQVTRDQLAYARLIVRQAQSQGGMSWLDYDRAFRQQVASNPSTARWNELNPTLLAATNMGQRPSNVLYCTLCRAFDHTRAQCALMYLEPTVASAYQTPRRSANPTIPRRLRPICHSWNQGECQYMRQPGGCKFRHACWTCHSFFHKAGACPRAASGPQPFHHPLATPTPRQAIHPNAGPPYHP